MASEAQYWCCHASLWPRVSREIHVADTAYGVVHALFSVFGLRDYVSDSVLPYYPITKGDLIWLISIHNYDKQECINYCSS